MTMFINAYRTFYSPDNGGGQTGGSGVDPAGPTTPLEADPVELDDVGVPHTRLTTFLAMIAGKVPAIEPRTELEYWLNEIAKVINEGYEKPDKA